MSGVEPADLGAFAALLAMAGATYLMRVSGFWLMGRIPLTPRVRRMLDALPGSIVAAIVVPIVVKTGFAAALGIAVAVALMTLRRNEFLAVFGALGIVALARAAGL
jgi:uncharacterized membrane protein